MGLYHTLWRRDHYYGDSINTWCSDVIEYGTIG